GVWLYKVAGVASNDVLNIRRSPSIRSEIVGLIPPNGREITVEDRSGHWWRINYNGKAGWVNRQFLSRDYRCSDCAP
ncbi:MAG TPA: SH3 domain-containing protein, partial [Acidobacteriaceae bacterium]